MDRFKEFQFFAKDVYSDDDTELIKSPYGQDWETLKFQNSQRVYSDLTSGFTGVSYYNKKTGALINALRGTEICSNPDILADIYLAAEFDNAQYRLAKKFHEDSLEVLKATGIALSSISFTGHSLGGFLAQLLSTHFEQPAITFNAAGAKHLIESVVINHDQKNEFNSNYTQITNYGIGTDIVFSAFEHQGRTQITNGPPHNVWHFITPPPISTLLLVKYHLIDSHGYVLDSNIPPASFNIDSPTEFMLLVRQVATQLNAIGVMGLISQVIPAFYKDLQISFGDFPNLFTLFKQ